MDYSTTSQEISNETVVLDVKNGDIVQFPQNPTKARLPRLKAEAVRFHKMGLNVLLVLGSKQPTGPSWEPLQHERQTELQLSQLRNGVIRNGSHEPAEAVAIVNGYGFIRSLDIDGKKNPDGTKNPVPEPVLLTVLEKLGLPSGYRWVERSQSGKGFHIWVKCPQVFPVDMFHAEEDGKAVYIGKPKDRISFEQLEIRWADSYTAVAGSANPELWLYGPPTTAPDTVTVESILEAFLEVAEPEYRDAPIRKPSGTTAKGGRVGDVYNQRGDVKAVLQEAGWRHIRDRIQAGRTVSDWAKPNSTSGHHHATLGYFQSDPNLLYVFSTEAEPFQQGSYTPFAVYTYLKHQSDFAEAAATLRIDGYGPPVDRYLVSKPEHTQDAYAERFEHLYGDEVHFVEKYNRWAVWDGKRHKLSDSSQSVEVGRKVRYMLAETLQAAWTLDNTRQPGQDASPRQSFLNQLKGKKNTAEYRGIAEQYKTLDGASVDPEALDADPYLLNLQNGTLDLRAFITPEEGQARPRALRPHDPADLITKLANVAYDPEAECPTWDQFIQDITCGDQEQGDYLHTLIAYGLVGVATSRVFPIFYGEGSNGKSTFVETVAWILGDYAAKVAASSIMYKRDMGIGDDIIALKGARWVTASEIPTDAKLNAAIIKDMTGNDTLTGRPLYGTKVEFTPEFALVAYANNKPAIPADDGGMWKRVHLVTFNFTAEGNKKDEHLKDKLKAEASGILNRALAAFATWYEKGLEMTPSMKADTEEFKDDNDHTLHFYQECFDEVVIPEGLTNPELEPYTVFNDVIYAVYEAWWEKNRAGKKANSQDLGHFLKKHGRVKVTISKRRGWAGIKLSSRGDKILKEESRLTFKG